MNELSMSEVQIVSGGNPGAVVTVALSVATYFFTSSIDTGALAANAAIALSTCGDGNVKSVDGDGFVCK